MIKISNRVIVVLDLSTYQEAKALIDNLADVAEWFKVGPQLFTSVGPDIMKEIKSRDKKLFLDLKFHDIPNTVAKASEAAVELGVDMFNMHVSGGLEMMRTASEAAKNKALELGIKKPILLGVTILTSINATNFQQDFGSTKSLEEQILYMAKQAQRAGLDGVVASPQEIELIKNACGEDFVVVTPGVRPEWSSQDDQKRTMTPQQALAAGADYVVIGRPIYRASEPKEALCRIIRETEESIQKF